MDAKEIVAALRRLDTPGAPWCVVFRDGTPISRAAADLIEKLTAHLPAELAEIERRHEEDGKGAITQHLTAHADRATLLYALRAAQSDKEAAVKAAYEDAAVICDERASSRWVQYKTDPPGSVNRDNPHTEGMSDGAAECAAAIRTKGARE